jgi:hypothetical protein
MLFMSTIGRDTVRSSCVTIGLSVVEQTGLAPAEGTIIHQRPVVIQDLEWRPRYFLKGSKPRMDPV